jgi:hypothetical protein
MGLLGYTRVATDVDADLVRPALSLGAHAYLITRRGAQRLLDLFRTERIWNHLDAQIQAAAARGAIDQIALRDRVATQTSTRTGGTTSSNIPGESYPLALSPLLRQIDLDRDMSMDYSWSLGVGRLGSWTVTLGVLVGAVSMALLATTGISLAALVGGIVALSLPDLLAGSASGALSMGLWIAAAAVGWRFRRSLNRPTV